MRNAPYFMLTGPMTLICQWCWHHRGAYVPVFTRAATHKLSSRWGKRCFGNVPLFDLAGTAPPISLQADLFLSLFSSPPYHFNFLFLFSSTAAVSLMTVFLSLKAYT